MSCFPRGAENSSVSFGHLNIKHGFHERIPQTKVFEKLFKQYNLSARLLCALSQLPFNASDSLSLSRPVSQSANTCSVP
ncbi:hypothetical protein PGT21_032667 [Puccinia graminis f. sp. tritici]|uniref:Uncharacterized protein n=1 Tax=Puccinia graminis f. sp. tritici TaxID=56615 RepID=A0A5B0PME5_PUCGR|nr:hypothetical protein PGT21_032667 [Puccinia graminis f. sp. tritici]